MMKVADLIALLQTHDPNAPVFLDDPDTSWFLPLHYGISPFHEGDNAPSGAVVFHALYAETTVYD